MYDLRRVAGKNLRFFLSTFANEEIKSVIKKTKENDNQNSNPKRWSQKALKESTYIEQKLEGLFEAGQEGLSKEVWSLIHRLECEKNDYYSEEGSVKGKLVEGKKGLLKNGYDQLLRTMAQVYAQLQILQCVAKDVPFQINKVENNQEEALRQAPVFAKASSGRQDDREKTNVGSSKTRNVVVFNNNPWAVTLRVPGRDMLLKSGQVMVFEDYDAEYIDYEIIGQPQTDGKKYKPYYFKKNEVSDQDDLFVILYQGFVEDDGLVKKTRKHLEKAKDLPFHVGDSVQVARFLLGRLEGKRPNKLEKRSARVYGQESLLKEFSYRRSRKADEYLANREFITKFKKMMKAEVDESKNEFLNQVFFKRLQEREMLDKRLEKQLKKLQTCETVLQDIYTVFKAVFAYKQTIEKKYSKIVFLAAKKEFEKEDTDILQETLFYADKTKQELNDIIVKWIRDKDLLHECFIDVIRFFERKYKKEYHPKFAGIVKKRKHFLPGLGEEIKKCFALCLLLQKRTEFLKNQGIKKNSLLRETVLI